MIFWKILTTCITNSWIIWSFCKIPLLTSLLFGGNLLPSVTIHRKITENHRLSEIALLSVSSAACVPDKQKRDPAREKRCVFLVGGFFSTLMKNMRKSNWIICRVENRDCLKSPPSFGSQWLKLFQKNDHNFIISGKIEISWIQC